MNYGLPYQGSKSKIADWILEKLPEAENLYDLFGGGGAITHKALLSNKYKNIYYNDIQTGLTQLFKDAVDGKYKNETRWISREDFNKLKDTDLYVAYCWSFGNKGSSYMYSKEYEAWKKGVHYAVFFKDYTLLDSFGLDFRSNKKTIKERKSDFNKYIKADKDGIKKKYIKWFLINKGYKITEVEELFINLKLKKKKIEDELRKYLCDALKESDLKQSDVNKKLGTQMARHYFGKSQWTFPTKEEYEKMQTFMPALKENYYKITQLKILQDTLQSLERLQRLQSLEILESLESLERLEISNKSYDEFNISGDSIIYCDIPYKNTAGYNSGDFDYEKFYDWCEKQTAPVYISEYYMPEDRFEIVAEKQITRKLSGVKANVCNEKLYRPKKQLKQS